MKAFFKPALLAALSLILSVQITLADKIIVIPLRGTEPPGTMVNNGAISITPGTTNQTIPEGYHDGNGYCQGDAALIPDNIVEGATLFGVSGAVTAPFTDNEDDTVTDNTKPMWQKGHSEPLDGSYTAPEDYCSSLVIREYDDWRLPCKSELKSLVRCSNGHPVPLADESNCGSDGYGTYDTPTIDPVFTTNPDQLIFWTSDYDGHRWMVHFGDGGAYEASPMMPNVVVRCVRQSPFSLPPKYIVCVD